MNELLPPPTARPVNAAVTPVRVEPLVAAAHRTDSPDHAIVPCTTDRFAIASAVCGLTAIIPVVSQVIGLALGVASMVRLRRARRRGVELRGRAWAWTGIVTSSIALVGWIAMLAALLLVGSSLANSATALDALLQHPA